MKSIGVIYKKEIKAYFTSPTFYIIAFLSTLVLSGLYLIRLAQFNEAASNYMMQMQSSPRDLNIHYAVFLPHLSVLNLLLIMFVPALTMKSISEEKKMRTFDLLLTSPVTSIDIVLGKLFAVLTAVFGITFLALLYPVVTSRVADFSWAPLLIAVFGIFMVAAVYSAMDLFASSLTESTLGAYVLAIVFNLSIWFIGTSVDLASTPWLRKILEHISLNTHLSALVEGTIRTNGLIFLFSVVALFAFLAERVVESSRWR